MTDGVSKPAELAPAFKYDGGKPRFDLIDTTFVEDLAKVLTNGSAKYDESQRVCDNNWRQGGMRWGQVYAAAMRHLNKFWSGVETDKDSGLPHLSHAAANLMFLHYYSRRARHLDDRDHSWHKAKKIALDIDEVLADWVGAISRRGDQMGFSIDPEPISWNFLPYGWKEKLFPGHGDYGQFMLDDVVPLVNPDLPIPVAAYITHRAIPSEITEEWIDRWGFPTAPVITVTESEDKVRFLKAMGIQVFVDDKFETFVQCQISGIECYLMDRSHNRHHDVGAYRIYSLEELAERLAA